MQPTGLGMDLYGLKANGLEFPIELSLSQMLTNNTLKTYLHYLNDCSLISLDDIEYGVGNKIPLWLF